MKKTNIFGLVLILSTLLIGCTQPNTSEDIPEVYTITAAKTTNGTISLSKTTAAAGETVTITATPASLWYELDTIAVSDSNGAVTVNNNSFTMPAGNVTVTVAFKEKDFTNCPDITTVEFYLKDNSTDSRTPISIYNSEDVSVEGYSQFVSLLGVVKYTNIIGLKLREFNQDSHQCRIDNTNVNYTVDSVELLNNILRVIFKEASI